LAVIVPGVVRPRALCLMATMTTVGAHVMHGMTIDGGPQP
jgi:hypothetical protein